MTCVATVTCNGCPDWCCVCHWIRDCARFSGGYAVERMFNRVSRGGESG